MPIPFIIGCLAIGTFVRVITDVVYDVDEAIHGDYEEAAKNRQVPRGGSS